MYICEHCGEVFEEPLVEEERPVPELSGAETWSYCPCCHSTEYEEVEKCKVCGQYCVDEFCEECKVKVRKAFHTLVVENFTEAEIELINILYDGEEI